MLGGCLGAGMEDGKEDRHKGQGHRQGEGYEKRDNTGGLGGRPWMSSVPWN